MLWRAVRARSRHSLALFAMGVVVFSGCVAAVGYSRTTSGTLGAGGPLLLLGGVALAGQGAASARARRFEIALAQLRGRYGLRLLRAAVLEPVTILLAACAVGTALGWVIGRALVRRWAGSAAFAMTTSLWAMVATVLVVCIAVVVTVSWRTTYEPLFEKLSGAERPRAASATSTFLSLVILLGAGVSIYQARSLGVRHADWVSYVSPALLGLAAGQIGVWLIAALARAATTVAPLNRNLGWFVTLRRLTRASDPAGMVRIVVAAVAVAGVAGSAWVGADAWRGWTARMQVGGPVTYAVPSGAMQAYAASHAADPDGRWLMAMSARPDPSGGSYRDVFVDSARWDRVVGAFYSSTPLDELAPHMKSLGTQPAPELASGARVTATFTAASAHHALPSPRQVRKERRHGFGFGGFNVVQFVVTYVDSHGDAQSLEVPRVHDVRPTRVRPGVVGVTRRIAVAGSPACWRACTVTAVDVRGLTTQSALRLTSMTFAGQQLVPLASDGLSLRTDRAVRATSTAGGVDLQLRNPYTAHPLLRWQSSSAPAALATSGVKLQRSGGQPLALGVDGEARAVRVVADVPALPIIGRAGVLLDLGTALRGAGGRVPETRTVVVARPDTPASVLAKLKASGAIGQKHVVDQALAAIRRSGTAQGTLLYTIVAVFCLLIALISVVSATADQRRVRRREAASLRVVGVSSRAVSGAYRGEAGALGLAVAVVTGIAVYAGCRALLAVLPLVNPGQFGLLFDVAPSTTLIMALAVGTGLVVALILFVGLRMIGRSSPPRLLRDDG